VARTFYLHRLGCPKNDVDADKLAGTLLADGMAPTDDPGAADVVVVNTCAFIEAARQESIDAILALEERRRVGARLVVTGCLAERYGSELTEALPEVDQVAGFGVPVTLSVKPAPAVPAFDLLTLPRPRATAPWAYVKIAEGCDRRCGFCAIPTFRGPQRSRPIDDILREVDELQVREVVLVAQDLAAYGRDRTLPPASRSAWPGAQPIVPLVRSLAEHVDRVRLLYLYPSDLTDALIDTILATGVPYFDLSLQHVSPSLLRRMRRWGSGGRFLRRIEAIRAREPDAAFRTNFIVGYPGETEADHDQLLAFVEAAQLDWCGFFAYSQEEGTYAAGLDGDVPASLVDERLAELRTLQDEITAAKRDALIGTEVSVLVDQPGVARGTREAPEIDGVVRVPEALAVGEFHRVVVRDALGPDLVADLTAAPTAVVDPSGREVHRNPARSAPGRHGASRAGRSTSADRDVTRR
jgi:ribosomal protein S12 methylthiotransferase